MIVRIYDTKWETWVQRFCDTMIRIIDRFASFNLGAYMNGDIEK
jgi:hypothetical protein